MSDWKQPHPVWIVGHRGAPRRARENTIESLDFAESFGVDAVEFDARQTRDGEAVLFHDEEVVLGTQRIPVRSFTWRELEKLSIPSEFGDLITQIDGSPVQGMTMPQAVEKMRGPINSDIRLTIQRKGRDPFDVKLTRATIRIQSVRSHLIGDDIGYIRITSFNEQTDVGLNNAWVSVGVDHDNYRHSLTPLAAAVRDTLSRDLD